jgi:hypothetical protein
MIKKFLSIKITPWVVEKVFTQVAYNVNNKEHIQMRTRVPKYSFATLVAIMIAFVAVIPAHAMRYNGACGGGSNLKDAVKGWQAHGVADDVISMTGQTVGLDGSNVQAMAKAGLVRVVVSRGTWVNNFTCTGSHFKGVGRKFLPRGYVLWVPAKSIHGHFVSQALQSLCGNKATGHIPIVVPKHKAKKHKKAKKVVKATPACPAGFSNPTLINSVWTCQSNTSSETASVANDCKGPNSNSSQCVTTIIQITNQTNVVINAICSQVTVNWSNGDQTVSYYDNNGNVVDQSFCNTVVIQPPPSITCPSGSIPNADNTACVKDGSTTPLPTGGDGTGSNPTDTNPTSSQCYWESAGTNPDGTTHASGDNVNPIWLGANGACPVGSVGAY